MDLTSIAIIAGGLLVFAAVSDLIQEFHETKPCRRGVSSKHS